MAYVNEVHSTSAGINFRLTAVLKNAALRISQYRIYAQTVKELEALSTRDLHDLGIDRSMIKSIAIEGAYGK